MRADLLLSPDFPSLQIPPLELTGVTESAAKADHASVFVCIRGARADGHDFAPTAYENGCRIFLATHKLSLPGDATVLLCNNTRQMLGRLACRLYGSPSEQMHVIGITGTKGKTTTARLITQIATRAGIPCGYIGTNGIQYADISVSTTNTTPDAVTLQRTLCDMQKKGVYTAVLEVSSQALLQHRVEGMHFRTVLFTNLTPDHIGQNEHASFEDYRACKHRLFTDFNAEVMICNADDASTDQMRTNTSASRILTCSLSRDADYTARDVMLLQSKKQVCGICFRLDHKCHEIPIELPLPGKINAANALMACATAHSVLGIRLQDCAEALANASIEGRAEMIPLPNGATVVIDYAHNGESLTRLLTALREYHPKRLICLFGSIGERAKLRRAELGLAAASNADLLMLTSDNPGREDPEAILNEIESAVLQTSTPYHRITDRTEAIRTVLSLSERGDMIVLAGKGHEREQLIGEARIPFSERSLIEEYFSTATCVK